MIMKLRSKRFGTHVEQQVFVGELEGSLALAGTLRFRVGEWQGFGAALRLGAAQMHGQLRLLFDGEEEVVQ